MLSSSAEAVAPRSPLPMARVAEEPVAGELIARCADGDRRAFERLFHLYEGRVRRYLATFRRDPDFIDEVLLDTMTAVWRAAANYDPAASASSWILAIARHKALDAVRRLRLHRGFDTLESVAEITDDAPSHAAPLARSETSRAVRAALEQLSPAHREVLWLTFMAELPYAEIAQVLGVPQNTVKTRVFHAKRLLQHALGRLGHRISDLEF